MTGSEWIALTGLLVALAGVAIPIWFAKRNARAETLPKISISVRERLAFLDGTYLELGDNNYHLNQPPYNEKPIILLFITIKNEWKVPVKIKRIGIQVHDRFDSFRGINLSKNHLFPDLPTTLDGFDQLEFYIDPDEVIDLLHALFASDESLYTVDAIDAIDRNYSSAPMLAKERFDETKTFFAALNVYDQVTVTMGEEEYFPDGVPEGHKAEESPNEKQ